MWPLLQAYCPRDWVKKSSESYLEVHLFNGSEIALKGAENRDSLRGATLSGVVLDEYGFMPKDVWTQIIDPALGVKKGWALFIGTPFNKNHFHTIYQYGQDGSHADWKSWQFSALDAGIFTKEELLRIKSESPQSVWEAEWEAKFLEGSGSVFRRIKENASATEKGPDGTRLYRLGVDLARTHNWTVFSVIDRHTFEQVYFERFNQLDWNLQKAKIEATALRYNNAEIVIDATGVGDAVVQDLERVGLNLWSPEGGRAGFKYTTEKKALLIENLAKLLEQDKLKIQPIDVQLSELESFTFYISESRFQRPIYGAPEGMTDDVVNALALSVWDIGEKLPIPELETQKEITYFENPYD